MRSPSLIYFSALDPDNSDSIVSSGDRLTVAFDIPTDRGGVPRAFWPGVANPDNRVDRAEIERLFAFSAPLGEEYSGLWTDASTLQITVVNATFAEAVPLSTTVALRDTLGGVVRNSFGNSVAAAGSALLCDPRVVCPPAACAASCKLCALCNFGEDNVAPGLVALTVEDVDNADTVYGEGDLISVIFDRATDRAGYEPGYNFFRAGVDGLFAFTHSLGERYSGEWADDSTFTITVINASNAAVADALEAGSAVTVEAGSMCPDGVGTQCVRSASGLEPPWAESAAIRLTEVGAGVGTATAPDIVSFVAADVDNGDISYGVGDSLTISFNGRTNLGADAGGMDFVDASFDMQPSLGSEYSGVWHDASTFIIDVGSASRQLQDYSGAYQTTPSILEDGTIVCDSFDRGAFADFSDVDREVIVSLNGVDFVRTQLTYKYYTQPYNITAMEPVTGGNTRGGTLVTLYGKGFHEFEGKRCIEELACSENPIPPKFARCRWTDGLTLDDTPAILLSGTQLQCAAPYKPETGTHDLFVSLNGADFDPTNFRFGFFSLENVRSRRLDLAVRTSIDAVPAGSPARAAFVAALESDIATALSASLGRVVGVERIGVARVDRYWNASCRTTDGELCGYDDSRLAVQVELLPAPTATAPSANVAGLRLTQMVSDGTSALYHASRPRSALIDHGVSATLRDGFAELVTFQSLSVKGGPLMGGTRVQLLGSALDAFNTDSPDRVRCRWGESTAAAVVPSRFEPTIIECLSVLNPSPGPQRLYLSLNGIEPYDDSGLDFTYFMEPEMSNFVGVSPGGGPAAGGTPVTVLASGLDALGTSRRRRRGRRAAGGGTGTRR